LDCSAGLVRSELVISLRRIARPYGRTSRPCSSPGKLVNSLTLAGYIRRLAHGSSSTSPVSPCDPPRQAHPRVAVCGRLPRFRRRVDRQRGASIHPAGPAFLGAEPPVGAE